MRYDTNSCINENICSLDKYKYDKFCDIDNCADFGLYGDYSLKICIQKTQCQPSKYIDVSKNICNIDISSGLCKNYDPSLYL